MSAGEERYLLDATVLRNIAAADAGYQNILVHLLRASHVELSAIAAAENFKAAHNHKLTRAERAILAEWMGGVKVAAFGAEAAEVAGTLAAEYIRKGGPVTTPDFMIAGQAVHLGYTLVTANTKHFKGFPKLKVVDWMKE